jgi:hypothetical protein
VTNLLTETLEAITASGHTPDDIAFIGSEDAEYRCSWEQFKALADQEYDSSFGSSKVAIDLIVRFTDGRKLWRGEYDGSEWWEFDKPGDVDYGKTGKPITRLIGGMWDTVAAQQKDDDE